MVKIGLDKDVVTLINVFTVEPQHQDQLLRILTEATERVICKLPGFVSATFHKSLDGTKIANYAQWESQQAFEALFQNSEAMEHMLAIRAIATGERSLYEVVSIHHAAP